MDEENKKNISICDTCEAWYPTIIHTCIICSTECAVSRGYNHITPNTFYCHECYINLVNNYENLLAFADKVSHATRYDLEEYGYKFTQEAEKLIHESEE